MAAPIVLLLLLLIMFTSSLSPPVLAATAKPPKACAPKMGCVEGAFMPGFQTNYFEAFLGIPYALPPVGELRFRNPVWHPKLEGVYNATSVKMDCIQKNYLLPSPLVHGKEDCLYLNVYRPVWHSKQKTLPVMVYIYGGGFFSGSSAPIIHGPEYFMDTQNVLLVTFNYRLGPFGFLSTNDTNMSGNWGLKDQRLALRWVRDNIAAFGGNPKLVTLFGQSAGSVSAHLHMLSKASEGLFRNIIALSGTANVPFAITENPLQQTRKVAQLCNITDSQTLTTSELTRDLRNVDAVTLVNAGDGLKYWHVEPLTNFRPVVESPDTDDAFVTQHPVKLMESGNYKAVPWMVSTVPHEGAVGALSILGNASLKSEFSSHFDEFLEMLLEWPGNINREQRNWKMAQIIEEYFGGQHKLNDATEKGFLDLITDRGFHHPLYNTIRHYVNRSLVTEQPAIYLFKFNYRGSYSFSSVYSGIPSTRNYGVVHSDDLLYLFRAPLFFPDFPRRSTDADVVKAAVENLVHFAKYSKPKNALLGACNKFRFSREIDEICEYQELINADGSPPFEVRTDNKFNAKRMVLWNELLN